MSAGIIHRQMLAMPGQRAALLGVMVIKQKKPSRNGVTGLFRQLEYCRLLEEMAYHVVGY